MKKVDAVIRDEQLPVVLAALRELGYPGITITSVRGHGRQRGIRQMYRGNELTVEFLPKMRIELILADEDVARVVSAIAETARTGNVGDGKIWVITVDSVMRVRTGEMGADAI